MSNSPAIQGPIGQRLSTPVTQAVSCTGDHNNPPVGIFPPELLDRIIDHLHDDRPTLRTLALVCRQTFVTSRLHLALNFEFADEDWRFDIFLGRMDVPWSSLSYSIQSLHLKKMFHNSSGFSIIRKDGDASRIADNLPNAKTLKLTRIVWFSVGIIPTYIRDLLFLLKITHLHLDDVRFSKNDFVEFFARLQLSLKTLTMVRVRLHLTNIPTLESSGSTFLRPFHFKVLDTQSLFHFEKVWDPLYTKDLAIAVDSFILRLCNLYNTGEEVNTMFISRFLHQVGPSLRHLYINISDRSGGDYPSLEHLASVDISQCTNLRILHIGTIEMDHVGRAGRSHEEYMLGVMWTLFAKLETQSHPLEEIILLFVPFGESANDMTHKEVEVESFTWQQLAGRLQSTFQHLKAIRFAVGYHSFNQGESVLYTDAFNRAPGTKELLEKGIVSFHTVPWEIYEHPEPTWRLIPTSERRPGDGANTRFGDF